jgi:hypothetical protein
MSDNSALKKLIFESYNGMSRPAMFWSIPIMPMVGMVLGGVVCWGAGTALFNWVWGLIFATPFAAALVALRILCMIDAQYLRRVLFACRRLNLNLRYGRPLLLTPFNPNWSRFYGQRFSQQRYAGGGESASAALSGGREDGYAAGQPLGEHDQAQGRLPRDPQ